MIKKRKREDDCLLFRSVQLGGRQQGALEKEISREFSECVLWHEELN